MAGLKAAAMVLPRVLRVSVMALRFFKLNTEWTIVVASLSRACRNSLDKDVCLAADRNELSSTFKLL